MPPTLTSALSCPRCSIELVTSTSLFLSTGTPLKFRKPVIPGDILELRVEATQNRGAVWKLGATAFVDGQKVSEAQLSAMIVDKNKKIV